MLEKAQTLSTSENTSSDKQDDWTLVCDDSNNGFEEDILEVVNLDFSFRGFSKVYRVVMKPTNPKASYEEFKHKIFASVHEELREYTADELMTELVRVGTKAFDPKDT